MWLTEFDYKVQISYNLSQITEQNELKRPLGFKVKHDTFNIGKKEHYLQGVQKKCLTNKSKVVSKYGKTLVLDSSYMPRSIINTERAFVITYKGNASVVAEHPESFNLINPELDIKKPSIIRVFKYVNQPIHKVPLSRENVYRRDNYSCVYCGCENRKTLTLDHVIPQSKGGKDAWDNLVTACKKCNSEKSNLTLEEYGKEIPQPRRPHYLMMIKQVHHIPEEWNDYLFF